MYNILILWNTSKKQTNVKKKYGVPVIFNYRALPKLQLNDFDFLNLMDL